MLRQAEEPMRVLNSSRPIVGRKANHRNPATTSGMIQAATTIPPITDLNPQCLPRMSRASSRPSIA